MLLEKQYSEPDAEAGYQEARHISMSALGTTFLKSGPGEVLTQSFKPLGFVMRGRGGHGCCCLPTDLKDVLSMRNNFGVETDSTLLYSSLREDPVLVSGIVSHSEGY